MTYKIPRFKIVGVTQEKSKSRDLLFSIQSEGLVWNHPQGVWNPSQSDGMASRVSVYILLRIDYIQHFVLIPYRRQASDFIHAYRRDYIESYVEVLDFQGLFVFLGVKTPFFTIAPFLTGSVTIAEVGFTSCRSLFYTGTEIFLLRL